MIFCKLLSLSLNRQTIEIYPDLNPPETHQGQSYRDNSKNSKFVVMIHLFKKKFKVNKFFFCLLNFHLDCVISSSIFAEISLTLNLHFILDCFKLYKFSNKFIWIISCSSKFCLSFQKKIRYSSSCCTLFY